MSQLLVSVVSMQVAENIKGKLNELVELGLSYMAAAKTQSSEIANYHRMAAEFFLAAELVRRIETGVMKSVQAQSSMFLGPGLGGPMGHPEGHPMQAQVAKLSMAVKDLMVTGMPAEFSNVEKLDAEDFDEAFRDLQVALQEDPEPPSEMFEGLPEDVRETLVRQMKAGRITMLKMSLLSSGQECSKAIDDLAKQLLDQWLKELSSSQSRNDLLLIEAEDKPKGIAQAIAPLLAVASIKKVIEL